MSRRKESGCKPAVIFSVVCLLITTPGFVPVASAAVQFPKCDAIIQWAASAYQSDKDVRGGNYLGGTYKGKYLLTGLKDELLKPTFGKTYDQWTDADINQFGKIAVECGKIADKTAWAASKQRKYDAVKFYNAGKGYLHTVLGTMKPANRVDSYTSIMGYQRKVYAEHGKAQALKKEQLARAKEMPATQARIQELARLAKDPQFAYLHPIEKKNHEITLHNRGVELADQIVDEAIAKFNSFPETLKGLTDLQAFRAQLQKDLKGLQSTRWSSFDQRYMSRTVAIAGKATDQAIAGLQDFPAGLDGLKKLIAYRAEIQASLGQTRSARWSEFEKAYAGALNDAALTAVDDFDKELAGLPATGASLAQVRTAVNNLFKHRPAPANLQAYRDIASNRSRIMQQDIRKIACYKELDGVDMDADVREAPLLGYDGETTLGLFVCDMNKRGNKFQSYEAAGWFGSTSVLSILNPRGITLTIEMEEVEAVKDKPMLVGVVVKDASSETKLTLTAWQDYALRLAGGKKNYGRY